MFFLVHGYLPEVVRHICDNPPCFNPAHLVGGSHADNKQDSVNSNRHRWNVYKGEDNPGAKLTEADVEYIRQYCADGKRGRQADMHRKFNVSRDCISRIVLGKRW